MKLKKDITYYNDKELDIFLSVSPQYIYAHKNKIKNKIDKYDIISNSSAFEIKNITIDEFEFIINNIDSIDFLRILDNKFKEVLYYVNDINIRYELTCDGLYIDNNFVKFIKNNTINNISIYNSIFNLDTLYTYNLNELYIDKNCDLKNLKYVESNNMKSLSLSTNRQEINRYIEWNNLKSDIIQNFASVGLIIKNLNPIKYLKYIYIEILKHDIIKIDNIDKIDNIIINKVDSRKIDISKIICNELEITDSNIDELIIDCNIPHIYINQSNNIDMINVPLMNHKKAFIKYFKNILNQLNNKNIDDITRYKYLRLIKKNKNRIKISNNSIDLDI